MLNRTESTKKLVHAVLESGKYDFGEHTAQLHYIDKEAALDFQQQTKNFFELADLRSKALLIVNSGMCFIVANCTL